MITLMKYLTLVILIFLCTISNIDHDLAFLEVVADIRYQRPITYDYWNWHDTLIRPHCGFTADNYRYSFLLWRLGRIKMEEVYLQQSSAASYLREWGL